MIATWLLIDWISIFKIKRWLDQQNGLLSCLILILQKNFYWGHSKTYYQVVCYSNFSFQLLKMINLFNYRATEPYEDLQSSSNDASSMRPSSTLSSGDILFPEISDHLK